MSLRRDKQDSRQSAHALDPVTASGGATRTRDGDEPEATSPHASRFSLLTGALVAFAMLTIFGAGMLASRENRADSLAVDLSWSAWQPTDKEPDAGSREIADHVGREYKLGNDKQLVAVTGGPMEVQGLPINLALREPVADGGQIDLAPGDGVLYRMCGLGPECSIDQGKPSTARHLLLRREALELAMYSFRYLKKTSNVVVFMPPARGAKDKEALFFQKGQLKGLVRVPLARTLTQPPPTPTTMRKSKGATDIDQFTNSKRFTYSLTQANSETSVFLVMDPVPTNAALVPSTAPAPKAKGQGATSGSGATRPSGSGGSGSGSGSGTPGSNGAPTIVQPLSPTAPG